MILDLMIFPSSPRVLLQKKGCSLLWNRKGGKWKIFFSFSGTFGYPQNKLNRDKNEAYEEKHFCQQNEQLSNFNLQAFG